MAHKCLRGMEKEAITVEDQRRDSDASSHDKASELLSAGLKNPHPLT